MTNSIIRVLAGISTLIFTAAAVSVCRTSFDGELLTVFGIGAIISLITVFVPLAE